jgi:hypothetical protein
LEDLKNYEAAKKKSNLGKYAIKMIHDLRALLDQLGYAHKKIMIVADGGYCNQSILRYLPERVEIATRCRKDASLCVRSAKSGFYDKQKFTPHDVYKDEEAKGGKVEVYYGRRTTEVSYREKSDVYWQRGAKKRALKVVIVSGMRYRKNKDGDRHYRQPIYLLTTDQTLPIETIIQFYLYRWEIEVSHRQLKNDLGMSQAQVWNETAVEKCPKTVVLAYSTIQLAYLLLKEEDDSNFAQAPRWYRNRGRISLAYLRRRLRREIMSYPSLDVMWERIFEKMAA